MKQDAADHRSFLKHKLGRRKAKLISKLAVIHLKTFPNAPSSSSSSSSSFSSCLVGPRNLSSLKPSSSSNLAFSVSLSVQCSGKMFTDGLDEGAISWVKQVAPALRFSCPWETQTFSRSSVFLDSTLRVLVSISGFEGKFVKLDAQWAVYSHFPLLFEVLVLEP